MSEQVSSESVAERRLVLRSALRTDVGLVRSENQDFGTCTTPEEEKESHPGGRLLIVADGMGGHRGGATASRLAAETVKAQFLESETTDIPTALRESLARANARIYAEAQSNPDLRGMGTTTSALAVRGEEGWLAHVGDSRIYRIRDNAIEQLTEDHSLVATMVREGLLTSQEAETHPRRNVLQRSMGVAEEVEVDVMGPFDIRPGDTFILCSDGLHGLVKENELREIAAGAIDIAADELLQRALSRGAPDNVTVIVARAEEASDGDALPSALDQTQRVELDALDETIRDVAGGVDVPPPASLGDTVPSAPMPVVAPVPEASPVAVPPVPDASPAISPATLPDPAEPVAEALTSADEITAKIPAVRDTPAPATAPRQEQKTVRARTSPATVPIPPRKRRGTALMWTLVLVALLGAAGAWYYWTQTAPRDTRPATSAH